MKWSIKFLSYMWVPVLAIFIAVYWSMPHYAKINAKMFALAPCHPYDLDCSYLRAVSMYDAVYDWDGPKQAVAVTYVLSFFIAVISVLLISQVAVNILLARQIRLSIRREMAGEQ